MEGGDAAAMGRIYGLGAFVGGGEGSQELVGFAHYHFQPCTFTFIQPPPSPSFVAPEDGVEVAGPAGTSGNSGGRRSVSGKSSRLVRCQGATCSALTFCERCFTEEVDQSTHTFVSVAGSRQRVGAQWRLFGEGWWFPTCEPGDRQSAAGRGVSTSPFAPEILSPPLAGSGTRSSSSSQLQHRPREAAGGCSERFRQQLQHPCASPARQRAEGGPAPPAARR